MGLSRPVSGDEAQPPLVPTILRTSAPERPSQRRSSEVIVDSHLQTAGQPPPRTTTPGTVLGYRMQTHGRKRGVGSKLGLRRSGDCCVFCSSGDVHRQEAQEQAQSMTCPSTPSVSSAQYQSILRSDPITSHAISSRCNNSRRGSTDVAHCSSHTPDARSSGTTDEP
jgi:hypothetical protein